MSGFLRERASYNVGRVCGMPYSLLVLGQLESNALSVVQEGISLVEAIHSL